MEDFAALWTKQKSWSKSRSRSVNAEPSQCYNAAGPALLHRRSAREGQKAMDVLKILKRSTWFYIVQATSENKKEKANDTRCMRSCFLVLAGENNFCNGLHQLEPCLPSGLKGHCTWNWRYDCLSSAGSCPSSRLLEYAGIQGLMFESKFVMSSL